MLKEMDLKTGIGKSVKKKKIYLQQNIRSSLIQLPPQEAADFIKGGWFQ